MYYKISNGSVTLGGNTILENINFYIIIVYRIICTKIKKITTN